MGAAWLRGFCLVVVLLQGKPALNVDADLREVLPNRGEFLGSSCVFGFRALLVVVGDRTGGVVHR